ncbi:unnamed protein product [Effrenium voratum]|uniref:Carrier domain-containing protein n=1 Tax=Effrenium voratum TaxID=2562239 RepID=A0AA36JJQ6_9DINO|nr:unnamed protein product [Effrenium voratum]
MESLGTAPAKVAMPGPPREAGAVWRAVGCLGRALCRLAECQHVTVVVCSSLVMGQDVATAPLPVHVSRNSSDTELVAEDALRNLPRSLDASLAAMWELLADAGPVLWAAVGEEELLAKLPVRPVAAHAWGKEEAWLCCAPCLGHLLRSCLGESDAFPPPDVQQLLVEDFNDTSHSWASGRCLPQLLSERLQKLPAGHPALVSYDEHGEECSRMTYQELSAHLDCAVSALYALRPGAVALWMPRCSQAVRCALAILRAGAVYVPCDGRLPWERVAFMAQAASAQLLVAGAEQLESMPLQSTLQVIAADELEQTQAGSETWSSELAVSEGDLAYVIFTSGSTGKPKGVAVTHRSIVHLIEWVNSTYNIDHNDSLLFTTSISFDLSCYDMFGSLAAGSTVHVAPELSPKKLFQVLQKGHITFWDSAPQVLQQLEPFIGALDSLRLVFLSGDWVPLQLTQMLRRAMGDGRVVALGGATEVTVWSNFFEVGDLDPEWRSIPYGRPIWNHQYYCLDAQSAPLHVGMTGELYIGGVGVARGYVGRADLSERFLENPFHPGRVYRTGDMVRFMPLRPWGVYHNSCEVVLEFLGRKDSQVKVRGFRVELAEVELSFAAQGLDCAVLALPSACPAVLVAFVRAEEQRATETRDRLTQQLPHYMVPEVCSVEALPLTRSGKVDRQALEAWWAQRRTAFRAPITKQQQRVVEAFREALGQEVGLDDDFFELGGHSLSAMRLQMALGDLSLQEVFHARTPAALAELLELRSGGVKAAPPLQKMERGDLVPASYAQERLWLAHCLQPGPRYNVAFAFRGRASLVALLGALQRLLERHEALRTVLQGGGEESGHGQLFQRILEAEEVKIPVSAPACAMRVCSCVWLQALGVEDAAVAAMRADAAEGFDLTSGLLRVRLFHSSSDFLLYFNVHHAAFDAASQALLKKELAMDLNGDHLQTPSVQYADYALWQQQWLAEGEKQRCLDYWKEELRGASFKLHLPTDVPRPRDLTHGFVTSRWPLSALAGVRSAAKQLPASEMAAMLSLFGLLLGRRFGQEDLLVGIPESGRGSDPALQNVVGFFVNTLPIRIRLLEAKETFMDLLGRTQKTLLDAMDHATIPFQHLVEEARRAKELDPGHSPLVQAFFQHIATGQFSHQSPMLEDFNFEALPTPAKFEVSLQTSVESSLSLRWEFMPEVLPLETIRLLDRHLLVMAKRLAADCNSALCHLRERPSDEHAAVLHDWSTSHALPLPDCRLEDLFIQQAMRTPKQTALVLRKNRLSFADLLAAAQALGARLGLAKSRVGVLAERSLELPVALLAVLMAGAAFVPLTPDLPRERLRFSLSEAKAGALLATPQVAATAAALAEELAIPWSIVSLDNLKNLESVETPARPAERIAYVLFTSGSTGRPKGVAVSHRALLSHLLPYVRILKLTPADRILQTSPFTFDMAYSQIFGALLSGAQLVLTRENPMVDPMELAQVLEQESVTFTTLVPSVLSAMVHAKPEICLPALRHLGCGGEPLRSRFRQVRLHNRYGPTECAINSTLFGPFGPDEINGERDVPIGWPSAHRHVAVEAGELLLAGPGLAGYVAREASAFRSSLRGAGQQYHTGDQVSRGTRGCLGFLGRRDFQVKLQGQRIELAEIEQVISTLPQVRSCAVVVNHVPMLVAFISGEAPQEVLAQCCKHLPPAMVPRVQVLDDQSWPRTSSNKLDRRALADMASKLVQDPQRVLGTSAVEEAVNTLLEVLADLGHVVSAACSLGLTSLLALRVVAQARRRGLELSVRRLLAPGATALAVATEATAGRPEDEAVDLLLGAVRLQVRHMTEPSGDWEVLVCPGDGGAGVEGYRPLAVALQSACRVWVVDGLLSTCRSLEEMAEEVLRCWRCSGKRRVLLGHSWGVLLALQLAQLTDVEAVWLLDPSKHHFAPAEPVMDHEAELLELLARLCQAGAAQGLLMAARSGRMTEMEKVLSQNQFQRLRQAAAARSHNLSLRASYKPLHVPVHVILASEMEATPQQRLLDAWLETSMDTSLDTIGNVIMWHLPGFRTSTAFARYRGMSQ